MKVYFASDHAGFELKKELFSFVQKLGHEVEDLGPASYDPADDYPDYIIPCAQKVVETAGSFGIIIGGSGQGEAMAANRIKGARAAVFCGGALDVVKITREHNDANILSIGARFVPPGRDEAREAVRIFLSTPFSGDERHTRRLAKF